MSISWAVFAHLSCRSDGIVELQEKETEVSRQCRAGQGRFFLVALVPLERTNLLNSAKSRK